MAIDMNLEREPNGRPNGRVAPSGPSEGSTTLKWGDDGELSPVDLQRVLARLTEPSLTRCDLDPARDQRLHDQN